MTKEHHCTEHTPLFMDSINGPERLTPCVFCQREQLRGNLSLAEEGLAAATQEIQRLKDNVEELRHHKEGLMERDEVHWKTRRTQLKEIGRLQKDLDLARTISRFGTADEPSERLTDCEASLRIYDPGQTSEYWLRHESGAPRREAGDRAGPRVSRQSCDCPAPPGEDCPLTNEQCLERAAVKSDASHEHSYAVGVHQTMNEHGFYTQWKCSECPAISDSPSQY